MQRSPITTHVLDTSKGSPAAGIVIKLEKQAGNTWLSLGSGATNSDGRVADLLSADHVLDKGIYRLIFETASYFSAQNIKAFYPHVSVVFEIVNTEQHYHVPLLLNPYGYSTYRGS